MNTNETYMNRCLELAKKGFSAAMPNPSVGAVIVYENKIIGEGFTSAFGGNHAEVNAINAVVDKSLLSKSTLYVSLEPCSHFGKTPPCADLIIAHKIPKVVIGITDSNEKVAGKGIQQLKNAGIDVEIGVLEEECYESNKRFFTFHNKKRPYIILKWAESFDGFIAPEHQELVTNNSILYSNGTINPLIINEMGEFLKYKDRFYPKLVLKKNKLGILVPKIVWKRFYIWKRTYHKLKNNSLYDVDYAYRFLFPN